MVERGGEWGMVAMGMAEEKKAVPGTRGFERAVELMAGA